MVLSPRARIGLLGGLALGAFLLSMIGLLPARVALGWLGLNGGRPLAPSGTAPCKA